MTIRTTTGAERHEPRRPARSTTIIRLPLAGPARADLTATQSTTLLPHPGAHQRVVAVLPYDGLGAAPADVPGHVTISLSGAERPLRAARRAVAEQCARRLPEHVVDDLQIIVSELVANVLEHGDGADGLAIDLTFHDDEVDLQVIGHGDRRLLPPFDDWSLPSAAARSGRGLALVRQLSDDITVDGAHPSDDGPGWVTITASVRATG